MGIIENAAVCRLLLNLPAKQTLLTSAASLGTPRPRLVPVARQSSPIHQLIIQQRTAARGQISPPAVVCVFSRCCLYVSSWRPAGHITAAAVLLLAGACEKEIPHPPEAEQARDQPTSAFAYLRSANVTVRLRLQQHYRILLLLQPSHAPLGPALSCPSFSPSNLRICIRFHHSSPVTMHLLRVC